MIRLPMIALVAALALTAVTHEADAGPRGRPLRTGQTTCWDSAGNVIACAGTGQDGELRAGLARAYVDNGDGTIRDQKTALTWEKLSDDGTIHGAFTHSWAEAFEKIDDLNTPPCFAGFCDWRLPNILELYSLVNHGNFNPTVFAPFNTGCVPGCTVLTCSCTASYSYWSSSTYVSDPMDAWRVNFNRGETFFADKISGYYVRAVRGGS